MEDVRPRRLAVHHERQLHRYNGGLHCRESSLQLRFHSVYAAPLTLTSSALCFALLKTQIFWGPLSLLLAVYLIPSHSPFRHPTQFAVSLGQLYGLVLYWAIPIMNELVQGPIAAVSRPGLILSAFLPFHVALSPNQR